MMYSVFYKEKEKRRPGRITSHATKFCCNGHHYHHIMQKLFEYYLFKRSTGLLMVVVDDNFIETILSCVINHALITVTSKL